MTSRLPLAAALLLLAGAPALAQHVPARPPPPRTFGPDRTSTHVFTGEGVTAPGLACDTPADPGQALACTGFLASDLDGTRLEVVVRVPRSPGPHPLVVAMHGWGGSVGSMARYDDPLVGAGYAVLRYAARGFGASWGQTNLGDMDVEGEDLRSLVGQVADDPRLAVDASAVAVFGASYGGAHAWLAALEPSFTSAAGTEVRIRAVVPVATWTDLLNGLVPNGRPERAHEVAGAQKLSYAQALFAGGVRARLDRPYPNYPEYLVGWNVAMTGNELPYGATPVGAEVVDGLQGHRSIYWQELLWDRVRANAAAGEPQLPVLLVQGWTDDLFPAGEALRMYDALRAVDPAYPVTLYLGDLGHPRAANRPGELEYVLGLVLSWLDGHLKPGGTPPPPEVRAAVTRPPGSPFDPADVVRVPSYDALATRVATAQFPGFQVITFSPANLSGFAWDPLVLAGCAELQPCPPAPPSDLVPGDVASYTLPAAQVSGGAPLLVAGEPRVSLWLMTFAPRLQLDVRLLDVAPDGSRALVTRGTLTLDTASARPLGVRSVQIPTFGNLWEVRPDHALRVEVTNVDSPYLRPSLVPSVTVLGGVRLALPLRER